MHTRDRLQFCLAYGFSPLDQYLPLARAADAHGWDWAAVSDHVVNPETIESKYPYSKTGDRRWEPFTEFADPWVAIGAMAAATEQLRFTTNVYVLPMRPPAAVAKVVATASVLSEGRVALGVGMGWMEEEFTILEQSFRKRGARADEMIEIMRKLWAGGWVEHHGTHYDFDPLEMTPAPGPIPIFVGGTSEPALRRAARNDGWVSDLQSTDELAATCSTLRQYRAELGREHEPFSVVAACKDAWDLDGYRRLHDVGVTHLLTQPWMFYGGDTTDLDARLDGIARFGEDIIARW